MFEKFKASRPTLSILERAEMEFEICKGKHLRAFADALGVDPGTIRRDLKLLRLGNTDKNKIARGGSVNSVLKRDRVRRAEIARQVRIGLLSAEIVDWVDRFQFGPGFSVNILDEVLRLLPQLRRAGELARIKPSCMLSAEIRRYTRPKKPNPNDPLRGFYVQVSWLIQWMFRCEGDYEVVVAATKLARYHYQLQPPTLPRDFDYLRPARECLKEQKTSRETPEAIRAEQSLNASAADARQNTESARAESVEDPRTARLRALMNSKEPIVGSPPCKIKLRTIGEERELQQQETQARQAARTQKICNRKDWEPVAQSAQACRPLASSGEAGKSTEMSQQGVTS